MNVTKFNRHVSMNSETLSEIMDIKREIRNSNMEMDRLFHFENMLAGLFDGFLYEDIQLYALELPTELASKVLRIYDICNKYPKLIETKA